MMVFQSIGLCLLGAVAAQAAITADGTNFTLTGDHMSYSFHVDPESLDLISDHFGSPAEDFLPPAAISTQGWHDNQAVARREFPDIGRSDVRLPAIHIRHADGDTTSAFLYQSHEIVDGKPSLPGLPATFGDADDVQTLMVNLYDNYSDVSAVLSYSVFPRYDAVARSFQITNNGTANISIERAASFSLDLPNLELDMIELHGDWIKERQRIQKPVPYGETGFRSTEGYSSHLHNPFFALLPPTTTETNGEAWGFSFIYSGSFQAVAERFSTGFVRVLLGLNPLHASFPVAPGETFTTPEAVAVYSPDGVGGMSHRFHDLYRKHLSRSNFTDQPRPPLLNSWEGVYFDYNATSILEIAEDTAALGISLFVNDDGWFGTDYPRDNDTLGLGDWEPNPAKFPAGLTDYTTQAVSYPVANSSKPLQIGIWVEPEMINPNSTLYQEHPDWVLSTRNYPRTLTRSQLVLNLALPEVQDFIITTLHRILDSGPITYIKWDNNRAMHELPNPAIAHAYHLGLYRILDDLTTSYPDVLFEGCASGGGRFDPGLLHYWPQHWTSDNTDAADRLAIQLGTSVVYPMSSLGCHISHIPNDLTARNISITFRAHVALMCGSFGFELDPTELSTEEREAAPWILAAADRLAPMILTGDFHRLRLPEDSNWPAVQFVSADRSQASLFAFQQRHVLRPTPPPLRLRGLDPDARYWNSWDNGTYAGRSYMGVGLNVGFALTPSDFLSELIWVERVD